MAGNPNLQNHDYAVSLGSQGGPKTEAGKLRVAVNAVKHPGQIVNSSSKGGLLDRFCSCINCPINSFCEFSEKERGRGCKLRRVTVIDYLKNTTTDFEEHKELIATMKADAFVRHAELLSKGKNFDKDYMYMARTLSEMYERQHKMEHGTRVNITKEVTFDDIRRKVFDIKAEEVKE